MGVMPPCGLARGQAKREAGPWVSCCLRWMTQCLKSGQGLAWASREGLLAMWKEEGRRMHGPWVRLRLFGRGGHLVEEEQCIVARHVAPPPTRPICTYFFGVHAGRSFAGHMGIFR